MRYDYHVHSTYSDGSDIDEMVAAAADVGLAGVGFTDHCNISNQGLRERMNYTLDESMDDRRADIERLRGEYDLEIYDAVEMDYDPSDEAHIREFLDDTGFDYSLGSVHYVERAHIMNPAKFADRSDDEKQVAVDAYFQDIISLIESELFDVVAHVDVVDRNSELLGLATEDHYRTVADALRDSKTVPEINAGRALDELGRIHPHPDLLEILQDENIDFVLGTDSHTPAELKDRVEFLRERFADRDFSEFELDF